MGFVKNRMMEIEARGYEDAPDRMVCARMFPRQRYIRERIDSKGEEGICDYCGDKTLVLPLQKILEMVFEEFIKIFENPAENLPFESGGEWDELEGSGLHKEWAGYILPDDRSIMSAYDALSSVRFHPYDDAITEEISNCFIEDGWVLKDTFEATDDERMSTNWDEFWKNTIKDKCNGISYDAIRAKFSHLLDYISESIASNLHSLTTEISKGEKLYRCVNYKTVPNPLEAENLWAPPADKAISQRMSREGQSRFYASFDIETPLAEAVDSGIGQHHCLGTFKLKENISVLDFTNIPEPNILNVPDVFAYRFFYRFAYAITQEVKDYEKVKYIPTQLMRDIIEDGFSRAGILGIKYRSVKGNNSTNVVLFLDNETCANYLILASTKII